MDAEGSFIVRIRKNKKCSAGYSVELFFQIGLHAKDKAILEEIQSAWGVGVLNVKEAQKAVSFTVSRFKDIKIVIDHFKTYPLITHKLGDYKLFKQAFFIMKNKEI